MGKYRESGGKSENSVQQKDIGKRIKEKEEQEQDFLRSHVPVLLLLFPRKIHDRRFMVNGREKFFENIGCFDLQAAGVDARMAAEIFVL